MTGRLREAKKLILALLALLGAFGILAASTSIASAKTAQLLTERTIEITGEAGRDSETRTLRFQTTDSPAITFAPSNLTRTSPQGLRPASIDSGQVRIIPVPYTTAPGPGFAIFELAVTSLPERYGVFSGSIDIRVEGEKTGKIDVKLTVRPSAFLALSPEPRAVTLQVTSSSRWLPGAALLAGRPVVAVVPISIPALPEGLQITDRRDPVLMSASGNGTFNGKSHVAQTPQSLQLIVDASEAAPDRYTGTGEIVLLDGERRLALPVEVSVRVNPWRVLVLILIGVLLGRLAKWMNDRGDQILAARNRVDQFAARRNQLDLQFQQYLEPTLLELRKMLAAGRFAATEGAITTANARAELVERAASLWQWAKLKDDKAIREQIRSLGNALTYSTDFAGVTARLNQIDAELGQERPVQREFARGARTIAHDDATSGRRWERISAFATKAAVVLHPSLELIGVLLLAFVGFEALYVNGSATFGANPVADYLTAIVWGLSADVAARTITSLGRTPVLG